MTRELANRQRLTGIYSKMSTNSLIQSVEILDRAGDSEECRWVRQLVIEELQRRHPQAAQAAAADTGRKPGEASYLEALFAGIQQEPVTITVTRFKLENRNRPWRWSYNYTVSGDPMLCQFGPGLADLRRILKRRHPGATIVETWKRSSRS